MQTALEKAIQLILSLDAELPEYSGCHRQNQFDQFPPGTASGGAPGHLAGGLPLSGEGDFK